MDISPEAVFILCRFIHFTALMLMFGQSFFAVILTPDRFSILMRAHLRKPLLIFTFLTFITSISWLLLQAGLMGDGWQDMLDPEIWLAVLSTAFGAFWRWILFLSTLAVFALFIKHEKIRNIVLLILSSIVLALHAFIGHGAIYDGMLGVLHQTNQIIHLICAAYWFGGLWPFILSMQFMRYRNEIASDIRPEIMKTLIRFSTWGHIAVTGVVVTGIISTLLLIPDWPHWSGSEYQILLWLKILLVVSMIILALINRYIIVPKITKNNNYQWLMMNSWLELLLGTLAIFCVAIFATYQPA